MEHKIEDKTMEQYVADLGNSVEADYFGAELYKYFGRNITLSEIPDGYTQDGVKAALSPSRFKIRFMQALAPFFIEKAKGT